MRTFAEKPKAMQPTKSTKYSTLTRAHVVQDHDPNSILNLQRTVGNQALLRLIQSPAEEPRHAEARGSGDSTVPPIVREVLHYPGQSLDLDARGFMERRFRHEFSRVRVHTDMAATESAKAINAKAFAIGNNIVFGAGEYAPHTPAGQQLLAHELVHVVQQGATPLLPTRISHLEDAEERQAEHIAASIFHNEPLSVSAYTSHVGILNRQTTPPPTDPTSPVSRRIVYIDASVFDQINRGNQAAANALRNMRSSGVDIRITEWTSREMLQQPELPRTATANRLLIQNLGIQTDPLVPFQRRVDLALPNQTRSGTVLSPQDAQVAMGARAGGGEIWSFDRAFRNDPQNIRNTFGVTVATESALPINQQPRAADYRVGRQLLGLQPVEISVSGVVRTPRPPGGSGGPGGSAPSLGGPGGESAGPTGTASAPARPTTGTNAPVARTVPSPSPELAIERARLVNTLRQQTSNSIAFSNRLQTYVRIGGTLLTTLEMVNTVGDILAIAGQGTTMPDVQRTADLIQSQSRDAQERAQATYDSISLLTATVQVGDAISRGDSTVLFELSESLGDFGMEASQQAFRYGELASGLQARSQALRILSDTYATLAQVPQGISTAPQASALAMHISLQRLSGTLGSAANQYDTARQRLGFLADFTLGLASRANSTAWTQIFTKIARQLAEIERQQRRTATPPTAVSSATPPSTPPSGQTTGTSQR